MLQSIGQIAVNVKQPERARDFYRDVLGLRMLFEYPPLSFFDCGGVRLMLTRAEQPEHDHPSSILYFRVANIAAAHRALAGRGVHFLSEPHVAARMPSYDLWLADFRDSEDNVLCLMAEAPRG